MDVCLAIENDHIWTTAYFIDKIYKYREYKCNINGGCYIIGSHIENTPQIYNNECITDDVIIIFDIFKLNTYYMISIFDCLEYKEYKR